MRQYKLLKDYKTHEVTIPAGSLSFEANMWRAYFGEPGKYVEIPTTELEKYTDWYERVNKCEIQAARGVDGVTYVTITNLQEPIEYLTKWLDRTLND